MNRKPTINDCKKLAKYLGVDCVMIVAVDTQGAQTAGASYGANKPLCTEMGKHLDMAMEHLLEAWEV